MRALNMTRVYAGIGALVVVACVLFLSRWEYLLVSVPSTINGEIHVYQNLRGVRLLRFRDDPAVQSYFVPAYPERVVAPYVVRALDGLNRVKPRRILVIGMGGGVMGMASRRAYPDAVVDLVDIDPAVVDLAVRYMGFVSDERMRVHVADGREFVRQVSDPYDLIFLDAFNGTDPPAALITSAFFRSVFAATAPGGLVVSNVVYSDASPFFLPIVARLSATFENVEVRTVPGGSHNRVVFASKPEK